MAFFTSFEWGVVIDDPDATMLEEVLQNSNLTGRELVLLLNSPGGNGLTAERIVNVCRSYCPAGFSVVVPKMAKSAATMICMGARRIIMSPTSELGPVDPQIPIRSDDGTYSYRAAHEIIESYNQLIRTAVRSKGRIDPYLQQLARFDARDIRMIESAQQLSARIVVGLLSSGTFKGKSDAHIRNKIGPFLNPRSTIVHGRPIYPQAAKACGLNVEVLDQRSTAWRTVWRLFVRLNHFLSVGYGSKIIESAEDSYATPVPRRGGN